MKLTIRHQLSIEIGEGASRAVQHLLLTPRNHQGQAVREWAVSAPGVETAVSFTDAFGNRAMVVNQNRPEADIVIAAVGAVETFDKAGVVGRVAGEPVPALFTRGTALTRPDDALTDGLDRKTRDRVALFHALMARVGDGTPPQSQSQSQNGQSQSQPQPAAAGPAELTHRFVGALRALGIPARYVTGYVAADEDMEATFHAWAEAYDEGLGWIGFDCALQLCPTERHVRLAIGLDATSSAPVRSVPGSATPMPGTVEIEAAQ